MDVQRTGSVVRPPSPMESLEKQLSCPICLEMFTKPVVILPCQHNLCRSCASDLYDSRNPYRFSGGVFRCPTCRFEVVLDRHGVHGLQRNLLVENIIDIYKQQQEGSNTGGSGNPEPSLKPKESKEPLCQEHEDERINIYCVTHALPTCSMCKVFGAHKDCEVAPLTSVYQTQKTELNDGIAMIVGNNDRMQGIISQLELACSTIEENSRRQKTLICEKFDALFNALEERKQSLGQRVTAEQEEKLGYIRGLTQRYGAHLEASCRAVETGITAMEEPEMALFLQAAKPLLKKLTDAASTAHLDKVEPGYENMDHFTVSFSRERQALSAIDFIHDEEEEEDDEEGVDVDPAGSPAVATATPSQPIPSAQTGSLPSAPKTASTST